MSDDRTIIVEVRIAGLAYADYISAQGHSTCGEKTIDRSPRATGSSAQLHARGKLKVGESFVHESIIETMFDCCIEGETMPGAQNHRST
ncbi:proline racemase family protein [Sulfitobacter sp. 1A12057]